MPDPERAARLLRLATVFVVGVSALLLLAGAVVWNDYRELRDEVREQGKLTQQAVDQLAGPGAESRVIADIRGALSRCRADNELRVALGRVYTAHQGRIPGAAPALEDCIAVAVEVTSAIPALVEMVHKEGNP